MNIKNINSAVQYVAKALTQASNEYYIIDKRHRGRHFILRASHANKPSFYALYKKRYFLSFNKQFGEFCALNPDLRGYAESINSEALDTAMQYDYVLFFHKDGRMYVTSPSLIKDLGLVRYTKSGERTYSIPLKLLKTISQVVS